MANEKHLQLRIIGDYDDTALQNEIWETSVRLALVFGGAVDDIGSLPNNWALADTSIARTETDWTITGNWLVDSLGFTDFDPGDFLNDQCAPAVIDWIPNMHLWQKVRVRALELYAVTSPSGKSAKPPGQLQGSPCRLTWTGNYPVGIGSTAPLPLQDSMCISHDSLVTGAHGRGRMYMPPATTGDTSATRWSTTAVNDCLEDHVTFLQALTYTSTPPTAGFNTAPIVTGKPFVNYGRIKKVKIGNVPDTQRRRRNRLVETYAEADV